MSHIPESSPMPSISQGQRLPFLVTGGHQTMLSASFANQVIAVYNAILNMKIIRTSNNGVSGANVKISNQNTIITLTDA